MTDFGQTDQIDEVREFPGGDGNVVDVGLEIDKNKVVFGFEAPENGFDVLGRDKLSQLGLLGAAR